jgi:hypothetical protein
MKKILFALLIIALLFSACGSNATVVEEPVVDEAATVVAEVLFATQTAMAAEKAAAEVVEVTTEPSSVTLNTDYSNAAPVYTQLIVGLLKLKDTAQAVTADQAASLLNLLSSLANTTPDNSLTEETITDLMDQAQAVLTSEQIQAISVMQITQESAMTVLQDLGLEMGGQSQQGEGGPGGGGPGGEGGEPPSGDPGQGGGPGSSGEPPADAQTMGTPSADGMDRGIMIQPQLIQALIEYLQSLSA